MLSAIKPGVISLTDNGIGRGAVMVVDLHSTVQAPHVTQPLMLNFSASVHYRFVVSPEELRSAGRDRYSAA